MAIRQVCLEGDGILTKTAKPVKEINEKIIELLDDMRDTMYAYDGVGLAAPQIGILKRVCIVDVGDGLIEFINPVILESYGGFQYWDEGCLSIPNFHAVCERPKKIKVTALNRYGKKFTLDVGKLKCRAICHEVDHLNGILFRERVVTEKRGS